MTIEERLETLEKEFKEFRQMVANLIYLKNQTKTTLIYKTDIHKEISEEIENIVKFKE